MMPRFTLVVRPDGKALLTANERLPETDHALLVDTVRQWQDGPWPFAILDDCDVVQVVDVELDLQRAGVA